MCVEEKKTHAYTHSKRERAKWWENAHFYFHFTYYFKPYGLMATQKCIHRQNNISYIKLLSFQCLADMNKFVTAAEAEDETYIIALRHTHTL